MRQTEPLAVRRAAMALGQQVDEKRGLQAAQKDLEPRRANYKDESGNLKAEFSFQLS